MGNFLINQKIKKIKIFDSFDYLINWDGVHTSYLNQGQCSTEKIKKSKKIKEFDSFDYLITRESIGGADSKGG